MRLNMQLLTLFKYLFFLLLLRHSLAYLSIIAIVKYIYLNIELPCH